MTGPLRRYWPVVAVLAVTGAVLFVVVRAPWSSRNQPLYATDNYTRIEDGLYMGGTIEKPPPGTTSVLNVCEDEDSYQAEIQRWEPIRDKAPAPSLAWLGQQVKFIEEQRHAGRTVFVHCSAGRSRSGLVMTAYLMSRDGCTRDEALATLRAQRPTVAPNPAFMELLLQWEKTVKMSTP
jgi:hypothetical protein